MMDPPPRSCPAAADRHADFSTTAELPQSPKNESQCHAARSPRRNSATVTWEFPKSLGLIYGGDGDANCTLFLGDLPEGDQVQPAAPRRNCARSFPSGASTSSKVGRFVPGSSFVGFVGSALAIAAKIQHQFRRIRSSMNFGKSSGTGTYKTYRTGGQAQEGRQGAPESRTG